MNIASERWETIVDFPNYMISSESRVMNKTTLKMVSIHTHKHGHRVVRLWNCGKTKLCKIYRLKAIHFIPNPQNKRDVNHIDGNRLNEDLENLEWVTQKENMIHAMANGFCGGQFKKGLDHQRRKLTLDDVLYIRSASSIRGSQKKLAQDFGVSIGTISGIKTGRLAKYV